EGRPRRRIKKKGGRAKVLIIVAALALLLGGGFLVYTMFFKKGTPSDFDLVPRDAEAFGSIRVADMLKTDTGKNLLQVAGPMAAFALQEFERKAGFGLSDIER